MVDGELPKLSVIVPSHDGERVLPGCLAAIFASHEPPDEVIVVDDASRDRTAEVAASFPCRLLRLTENEGAGGARNAGAEAARHPVLVFLDDDTTIDATALAAVRARFAEPELQVLCGLVEGGSLESGIVADLTALDWAYAHEGRKQGATLNSFCMAIRKDLLVDLGGFPTRYPGAGGEEFDLSRRILERTPIALDPSVKVRHRFKGFVPRFRDLLRRSRNIGSLYLADRKVNEVASARNAARALGSGAIAAALCLATIAPHPGAIAAAAGTLLFLAASAGFYRYIAQRRGLAFLVAAFPFDVALSLAVFLGAAHALLSLPFRRSDP